MSKLKDWFRENFRLKEGEPEKEAWFVEGEHMRNMILVSVRMGLYEDLRIKTFTPEQLTALVAATFPILRKTDDDWKALDAGTAYKLYVGVALMMLKLAYRKEKPTEDGGDEEGV